MIKRLVLVVILTAVLAAVSVHCQSPLQMTVLSERVFGKLPELGRHPILDMANGYVGIISGEYPRNSFHLFDSTGTEILGLQSENERPFFIVDMRSCDSIIFLAQEISDEEHLYSAYNYSGKMLLAPFRADDPVKPSPSLKYLYTQNTSAIGPGSPIVYDSRGQILDRLEVKTGLWELNAINDSLLLFQDWNKLKIISYPALSVMKEILVDGITPPKFIMYTALSDDGKYYAFVGRDRSAICNLESGTVFFAKKEEHYVSELRISLTPHAEYFIYYQGKVLSMDKFDGMGYTRVIENYILPADEPIKFTYREPFCNGNLCALNYYYWAGSGILFKALVFNYLTLPESMSESIILDGHICPANHVSNNCFYVLKMGYGENSESSQMIIELKESSHEQK